MADPSYLTPFVWHDQTIRSFLFGKSRSIATSREEDYWGSLMAVFMITALPIGVLYNLFLDRFIEGFTVGAVKQFGTIDHNAGL